MLKMSGKFIPHAYTTSAGDKTRFDEEQARTTGRVALKIRRRRLANPIIVMKGMEQQLSQRRGKHKGIEQPFHASC